MKIGKTKYFKTKVCGYNIIADKKLTNCFLNGLEGNKFLHNLWHDEDGYWDEIVGYDWTGYKAYDDQLEVEVEELVFEFYRPIVADHILRIIWFVNEKEEAWKSMWGY